MEALVVQLGQMDPVSPWSTVLFVLLPVMIIFALVLFLVARYRRCPPNRVLVVYGELGGQHTARCLHGGGMMVWPVIQSHAYLSLEPLTIDVDLLGGLTQEDERANVSAVFTVQVSTRPDVMQNAAERLLGLDAEEIEETARPILLGQLRAAVATSTVEQLEPYRENLRALARKNADHELNKIGLTVVHVDITVVERAVEAANA